MARNGSGTYILPPSNPVVSGTVIESDWANDTMSDLAAALSQSIAYDGQTIPIANLPMGGFHHTNVSDPAIRNQYATLGMVQDGRHQRVENLTGVDNLVGTLVGGATAYTAGQLISFFAPATNTGSMTINFNGIGARSLTDQNGLALTAGEIAAGEFVFAIYTGTEFRLISSVDAAVAADLYNLSISGQVRPPSDVYPALTIATGTTVNVPAGSAWIVPPGNDVDDAVLVTWANQTITMQFLSSSFTTFVMVDETGAIQQIPGRAIGANFRHMAVLGVVEHITGTVNNVITRPSIFGDDGYRNRDAASLLANTVINGALVTPNSVSTLNLDVAQGTIFIPGGTANTVDSPNTFNVPPQANIQFRTVAGQALVSALTATVPVGSYDANGAGIIAALPSPGDATVHRLFYLYGQYLLVYGQQVYSSVENALSMIAWDRTKFKKSLYLADATLLAEVIAIRTATNLNLIGQGAVVCPGGLNFSIGSPGGIAEAPIDGFPYGRRNAAWFQVLGATSPTINVDATISGPAPKLKQVMTPYAAGTVSYGVYAAANKWFTIETVNPDDKTYFRSYNPGTGALRFTTTYDLANGDWSMPASLVLVNNLLFTGASSRIRGDFSSSPVNLRTMFQSSVANGITTVSLIPNGTSPSSGLACYGNSDVNNAPFGLLSINNNRADVSSGALGTGTALPLTISTGAAGNSERIRIEVDGRISLTGGPAAPWDTSIGRSIDFANGSIYNTSFVSNAYWDGAVYKRRASGPAALYQQLTGEHVFFGCETGSAGATANFVLASPILRIRGNVTDPDLRNVCVGDNNSGGKLFVGSDLTKLPAFRCQGNTAGDLNFPCAFVAKYDNNSTTSQAFMRFAINSGTIGSGQIVANGAQACTFGSTSDVRLKENIENLPPQLDNIMALRPVEFDYKEGGHNIGFIAQEVQEIYPDVVAPREDGMLILAGWSKTEAVLVKALQEAVKRIEELEKKLGM